MSTPVSTSSRDARRPKPPTPSEVTLIQAIKNYPAVSLLMSTTPSARMLPAEADQLRGLAREAHARLDSESLPDVHDTVLAPLHELVEGAARGPTTQAVAVFVSARTRKVMYLDIAVADRVVVDPTFATRDLVRALHRTPRHVALLLSQREARLLEGMGDELRPVAGRAFPRLAGDAKKEERRSSATARGRRSFYRDVDRALGTYLTVHPAPLVLVGTQRELAEFRDLSQNLSRLAGSVHGSLITAPAADLTPRIRPVLQAYLRSRQQESLDLLDERVSAGRAVSGIASAWMAAHAERPEMLTVEEGYFYPARVDASGELLTPAADLDHPDVLDDAVDELIEAVLRRGGWVALVQDGALRDHDRVALTLRR